MESYNEYEQGIGGLQAAAPFVKKFAWLPIQVQCELSAPLYRSHKNVWLKNYYERRYFAFGHEMIERYETVA